jgi:hypothetical protein
MKATPDDVMEFLHAIERGEITIVPERSPQDGYCGGVLYVASNGWKLVIFNDCNEWDYVSEVILDDGTRIDPWVYPDGESLLLAAPDRFDDLDPRWDQVRRYRPRPAYQWSIYRIPGYLNWRCEKCNAWLPEDEGGFDCEQNLMLCKACGGKTLDQTTPETIEGGMPNRVEAAIQSSIREARQLVLDDEAKLAAEQES